MRQPLPDDKLREIAAKLPKVDDDRLMLAASPGFGQQIQDLVNNTKLGVAFVCLDDARQRFGQVATSLHEAYACQAWYREYSPNAPRDIEAVFTSKYYVDYATLLLYATAEDISFFIIHFLNIEAPLTAYLQEASTQRELERKKISSNAGKVGLYLAQRMPTHEITRVTMQLNRNSSWKQAINYRNTWVHSKPPIVEGMGIQYTRESAIETLDDGTKRMYFGGGSPAQFTIDQLTQTVQLASEALAQALSALGEMVIARRASLGEALDFENRQLSITLESRKGTE